MSAYLATGAGGLTRCGDVAAARVVPSSQQEILAAVVAAARTVAVNQSALEVSI